MSEGAAVRGILLAHGGMARGMTDAIRKIAGVGEEVLIPISNEGKSPEALQAELDDLLGASPGIVFTDMAHGSCAVTARICCREERTQAVLFGVNLPVLLDFVFHRHLPLHELVPRLLEKGQASLRSVPEYSDNAHRTLPS
ncbi:PTS sugar transporter subunit IIA [Gemmatimonadota bacterium]